MSPQPAPPAHLAPAPAPPLHRAPQRPPALAPGGRWLSGNSLSGTLPTQLFSLSKLGYMCARPPRPPPLRAQRAAARHLPLVTSRPPSPLPRRSLRNNLISGSIPSEVAQLTKLSTGL